MSATVWNDTTIACSGCQPLGARVHRAAAGAPLVLHLHGGAFVAGAHQEESAIASLLADAGAAVVSLDYPLAPEHPFPQAIEAAHVALEWLHRHRRRLAAADAPVYVAGEEAGGNLAAAVALMARDRAGPHLQGQILLSPMLDVCTASKSLREAKAGHVGCTFADGWRQYLPRACDAMHPYATPGASMRLAGLPRTLLVTAEDDLMRDETRAFARRLRDAGVAVEAAVLPLATGWPATYRQRPPSPAPWQAVVRERLRQFLFDPVSRSDV